MNKIKLNDDILNLRKEREKHNLELIKLEKAENLDETEIKEKKKHLFILDEDIKDLEKLLSTIAHNYVS